MEDIDIYARYGRKQEQLEIALEQGAKLSRDLLQTMELLRRLKTGEALLENLELTATSWSLIDPVESVS